MIPTAYLESIRERLVTDPLVVNFRIRRERHTASNGYLRALLLLSNGTQLEFSEYFQLTPEGDLVVITYSYNWSDMDGVLIQRWDNTPHYPDLPGYPHHVTKVRQRR